MALFVVAAVVLPPVVRQLGDAMPKGSTFGDIYIDTPTVYTRERLVNDRFRQEAWLDQQLREADDLMKKGAFANVEAWLNHRRNEVVGTSVELPGAGENRDPAERAIDAAQTDPASDVRSFEPAPIDQFRDAKAYRDEIRAEIMRTQLDDRHDIEGNTLYRLNFDATIAPGSNTKAPAVITVTIEEDDDQDRRPSNYAVLYADWRKHMQLEIDKAVAAQTADILGRGSGLASSEKVALQEFLDERICGAFLTMGDVSTPLKDHEAQLGPKASDCSGLQSELQEAVNTYLHAYESVLERILDLQFAGRLRTAFDGLGLDKVKGLPRQLSSVSDETTERWSVALRMARNFASELCVQSAHKQGKQVSVFSVPLSDQTGDKGQIDLPCPMSLRPQEPLIGTIAMLDKLRHSRSSDFPELVLDGDDPRKRILGIASLITPYLYSDDPYSRRHDDAWGHRTGTSDGEKISTSYTTAEALSDAVPRVTEPVVGRVVAEFLHAKLNNSLKTYRVTKPIDDFFDSSVEGCRFAPCTVVLKLKDLTVAGEELRNLLNQGAHVFSYAVSPEELVQRVASEASTRLNLQTTLRTAAGGNGHAVKAVLEGLNDLEERVEMLHRNPIVVGFAGVSDARGSGATTPQTTFGWVVQPRLVPTRDRADGAYRHVARHYPLSAVVSVPSWWKSLKITVRTSWLDDDRGSLRRLFDGARGILSSIHPLTSPVAEDGGGLCRNDHDPPRSTCKTHYVKVPGSIKEIKEKLGYEVRKEPYIDHDATAARGPQVLEIGRSGRIVLEGGRLWRSTVVLMGQQRADEIVVLPDMSGVIAKFDCVRPPPGEPGLPRGWRPAVPQREDQPLAGVPSTDPGRQESGMEAGEQTSNRGGVAAASYPLSQLVTVSTSEGRTAAPIVVNLQRFEPRGGDVPCFLRERFRDEPF